MTVDATMIVAGMPGSIRSDRAQRFDFAWDTVAGREASAWDEG